MGGACARRAYIEGGKSDAAQTAATIRHFRKETEVRVLEFASGYGRVTRHLRDLLPGASLYASDIHPQACEFVTANISVPTLQSSARPEDLNVGSGYDFIFVIARRGGRRFRRAVRPELTTALSPAAKDREVAPSGAMRCWS